MNAVRTLKKAIPGHVIVADMKTMDTGAIEVEMAAKAGAGVVSILGASHDSTFEDAARSARKYGVKLAVDLINVPDPAAPGGSLPALRTPLRLGEPPRSPAPALGAHTREVLAAAGAPEPLIERLVALGPERGPR
jgi:hypothetical protein